jgi:hypothetical protein
MYEKTRRSPRLPFIAVAEIGYRDLPAGLVVRSPPSVFMAAT